jgi:hypothetical protein
MPDTSNPTRPPTIGYRPSPSSTLADPYDTSLLPDEITLYRTRPWGPARFRAHIATTNIQSPCGFAGTSSFWADSGKSMRDLKQRSRTLKSVTVKLSDFEPTNTPQNVMDDNGEYQLTDAGEFYEATWKIGRMKADATSATFEEAGQMYEVDRAQDPNLFEDPVFKRVKVTMGGAIFAREVGVEEAGVDEDVVLQHMVDALVDG